MTLAILIISSLNLLILLGFVGLLVLLLMDDTTHPTGFASMDPPLEEDEV